MNYYFLRATAFAQGNAQDFGLWIRFVGLGWAVPAGGRPLLVQRHCFSVSR